MEEQVNVNMFNDSELIANAASSILEQLAAISVNSEQLDKVAHANNVNSKVVTAILNNNKVKLRDLDEQSFLALLQHSEEKHELSKMIMVINELAIESIKQGNI